METEKGEKKYYFKRFIAYILDVMLVGLLVSALNSISWLNPNYKEYEEVSLEIRELTSSYYKSTIELPNDFKDEKIDEDEYNSLIKNNKYFGYLITEKYEDNEITQEEIEEIQNTALASFREISSDLNLKNEKASTFYYIIYLIVYLLYFVLFNIVTNGQTLFKKVFKLKIVDNKTNEDVKWYNYLIRSVILYGLPLILIKLGFVLFAPDNVLKHSITIMGNIGSIYDIIIMVALVVSKEARGIHDKLSKTKVIYLEEK